MKSPKNENYAAIVVQIKTLIPIPNCDNVVHAIIMGNQVVVGKDVQIGDFGLYFPLETQLSEKYLKVNNLYRKSELNEDPTKKGYFEENGRIRCVKFRGNKSEGLFMSLTSLDNINFSAGQLSLGDCFDELNDIEICRKYVVKKQSTPGLSGSRQSGKLKKHKSKLIDNQFRFHSDTSMMYKNLHMLSPHDIISITYKIHGSSFISSKILCKKPLKWYEKILTKLKINIINTHYDYLYSSRKVIKNSELNSNPRHYYNDDIWEIAHNEVKDFLIDGMTIYGEIAGFLPSGGMIQKDYDYGCEPKQHKLFIYRITYTNLTGKVFEFSAKQVQDFCKKNGLNAVPQLYYGYASELNPQLPIDYKDLETWRNNFLTMVKEEYNDHDCHICQNPVPEEGVVIRLEKLDFEAYKQKSGKFYERETKLLDKGETNIEDEN